MKTLALPDDESTHEACSMYRAHCANVARIISFVCSRPQSPGGDVRAADEAVGLYLDTVGAPLKLVGDEPGLLHALKMIRAWAIPGMNWTDDAGRALLEMADAAIARADRTAAAVDRTESPVRWR